jgi:L-seryl-tRNA(Ser) seleniumtransferase
MAADDFAALPSVERVRTALGTDHPHEIVVGAARRAIDVAREEIRAGSPLPTFEEVVETARGLLEAHSLTVLGPVINATGVLLHTNLGRAPLGRRQLEAVARVAEGYSNLEFDLLAGRRGSRHTHARSLLIALTGAESGLVVNNNAAAVLVTLAELCAGREVVISRGELIEIGGEFRIPEIMAASGTRVIEVGTTNRTHIEDYERAITSDTAAVLKVHPSNYKVVGFTASVSARDLARLTRGRKVTFIHDIGSGATTDIPDAAGTEPTISGALEDGADIVTFSGDKLLGGPQAGVILGRSELIDRIATHPLMRVLRVDKMTLAALEETLRIYLERALEEVPLWQMATTKDDKLERRAHQIAERISAALTDDAKIEPWAHRAVTGGGSLPGTEIGSWAVRITHATRSAAEIERVLRTGRPPIVGVIEDDNLLLDLRTVDPRHDDSLVDLVIAALSR